MQTYISEQFDVAVIGAGHAGLEAAFAAARMGAKTALFTLTLDLVGNMPCNPSIGGTGKGHLVYEIDALGGEMGKCADAVTLQSRTLNLGKGAAVHSKRVQADRVAYHVRMKHTLEQTGHLRVIQAEIKEIVEDSDEKSGKANGIRGVVTHLGEFWSCESVIIATGTYPEARIFVGDRSFESGPDGSLPSKGLSACLAGMGILRKRKAV